MMIVSLAVHEGEGVGEDECNRILQAAVFADYSDHHTLTRDRNRQLG